MHLGACSDLGQALQVMVVSCGLLDVMDLVWWQPYHKPLQREGSRRHSSVWLPSAIEVTSDPDKAEVCALSTHAFTAPMRCERSDSTQCTAGSRS